MSFKDTLKLHIKAKYPILYVSTAEEGRLVEDTQAVARVLFPRRKLEIWDCSQNFSQGDPKRADYMSVFELIENYDPKKPVIFVLKDFYRYLEIGIVVRSLKNLAPKLRSSNKTVVIAAPFLKIPIELEEDIVALDYPLPDYDEIGEQLAAYSKKVDSELNEAQTAALVRACQGLSMFKINSVLDKCIVMNGMLDGRAVPEVMEEKRQILKNSELLEFYPVLEDIGDVGGLSGLKNWLHVRSRSFSRDARDYGLPEPRGLLLLGIQGTGKSLFSKVIAKYWGLPLLRLDTGRLMGSYVGESEDRARRMIKTAEAMSPCVLWIDEIDKAFSSLSYRGDSGASSRVFSTLITWMQEKKKPVFIAATANSISNLPPELLRKGRFDEIFFIDLPDAAERREIFELHLKKRRGEDISRFDCRLFSESSEGFSGAEIEHVIIDAMYEAFSESREFGNGDILACIKRTIPLSVSSRETIEKLRSWASEGRARKASKVD